MTISVFSEVGSLEEVLVHAPGPEIERMTQDELDRLLFDDILSLEQARREHQLLREILGAGGARVLELTDLLLEALRTAPAEAIADLLDEVCERAAAPALAPILATWRAQQLADGLIQGVYWTDLGGAPTSLERLRTQVFGEFDMPLRPVPNAMFVRDPCMSVFDRVLRGRMATRAREREPALVEFALRWTGRIGAEGPVFPADDSERNPALRSLEGGDVLVLSERFLLIGCSERTTAQTIERVTHEALFPTWPGLERVYAVLMPARRSVMHLDTVLTQIDDDLFLGHAPLISGGTDRPGLAVARLERGKPPALLQGASVLDVLRDELGAAVQLVPCGGDEKLHQEREQWTDGANAVCIAPGRIVLYGRNRHTIRTLCERAGFTEIALSVIQSPADRAALLAEGMRLRRTVFSFSGGELSRARGGGRCMTMPLRRSP